jgi:radical SAM protein with 4Fe4S-binding SPASM domain
MMTWLRTHATLIDHQAATQLKEAGLGGAFVDLMGANAATHETSTGVEGSFQATCSGVRHLLSVGIDTRLLVILNRRTAPELNDVLRLASDLGIEHVSILRFYPIGRAKRLWNQLALSLDEQMAILAGLKPPPDVRVAHSWHPHDKNCCWSSATVDAYGRSIGCPYLRELVDYGNVLETPFLESWHNDPLYRQLRSGQVARGCGTCETREGTQGGCRATAFAFSGRWDAPDPFCPEMNEGIDLRVLPDRIVRLPTPHAPQRRAAQKARPKPQARPRSQPPNAKSAFGCGRPDSYRLVPGTRVREVPERDVCLIYTPETPALYALQDEAWLIFRNCLGRTREEVIRSYAEQVAAAGITPEEAMLEGLESLSDLVGKRIIEQVV